MKAIQQQAFGGPEELRYVEVDEPKPEDGEVLVDVTTCGINFADLHTRENRYVAKQDLPLVPGAELAGVRRDTGERVIATVRSGGYAQVAAVRTDRCWPIPDGVEDGTALALFLQGLTAWHLFKTQGRLAPGETVVVVSGAGGVGSLAVQLAGPLGAGRVIATASSEDKRALCLELGADAALDGDADGLAERLLEANDGRPVDLVCELAGGAVFDACREALAPFGRLVAYGISSKEQNEVRTGQLLKRSHSVIGFWLFHGMDRPGFVSDALADLFARAARGELRVVVGGTYGLSEARAAQEALAARTTRGKLLLDPSR